MGTPPAHTERVRAVECAEIVALDVFNRADGKPVTMSMVQRRLGELLGHRPSCRCGLCAAAVKARAAHVLAFAQAWQRAAASSRARMAR